MNDNLQRVMDMNIDNFLASIADGDSGCREQALEAVKALGMDVLFPFLDRALRLDADADLRNGAMEVLISYGSEAVPCLVQLLQDENEEVRNFSTVMLGTIGSRDAVAPLIDALHDPDVNVRHGAAEALGRIGDTAALQPLAALLDGEMWLRHAAIVALGEIADIRAVPHLARLKNDDLFGDLVAETITGIWSKLHSGIKDLSRIYN